MQKLYFLWPALQVSSWSRGDIGVFLFLCPVYDPSYYSSSIQTPRFKTLLAIPCTAQIAPFFWKLFKTLVIPKFTQHRKAYKLQSKTLTKYLFSRVYYKLDISTRGHSIVQGTICNSVKSSWNFAKKIKNYVYTLIHPTMVSTVKVQVTFAEVAEIFREN